VEQVDGARDDHRRVAHAVRQQILQLPELAVCLVVDRHPDLVAARRERRHDRRPRGCRRRRRRNTLRRAHLESHLQLRRLGLR
jgi:hypothetical protein